MRDNRLNQNQNVEPKLSLEKAEEILKNVYKAAGINPPENCAEILRKGAQEIFE